MEQQYLPKGGHIYIYIVRKCGLLFGQKTKISFHTWLFKTAKCLILKLKEFIQTLEIPSLLDYVWKELNELVAT